MNAELPDILGPYQQNAESLLARCTKALLDGSPGRCTQWLKVRAHPTRLLVDTCRFNQATRAPWPANQSGDGPHTDQREYTMICFVQVQLATLLYSGK